MVQINSEFAAKNHRRHLVLGGLLMGLSLLCVAMTILFLYVSNSANRRVEDIRREYRAIADRREAKVDQLTSQVTVLQRKLDGLPDRTANKTADKVKQQVNSDGQPGARREGGGR